MKTVAIIGLGTITQYYIKGLESSSFLSLKAVCDISDNSVSRNLFSSYPFYNDYKEMIEKECPDYIIISTPPLSHFEIASYAFKNHVNVIVEKPAVLNSLDYSELSRLAEENNCIFEVMYHWQNGSEVLCFNKLFDTSKITEIYASVEDPYSDDGVVINDDKVKLRGVWVDSGVNILSMIKMWLPFENMEIDEIKCQKCEKTGLPIFIRADLHIDSVKTTINIDWRNRINHKESYVIYDGKKIVLNHSGQCIVTPDETVDCYHMERLAQHYYHYFSEYREEIDSVSSIRIHDFLFKVNEEL